MLSTFPDIVCRRLRLSLRLSCTRVLLRLQVRYISCPRVPMVSYILPNSHRHRRRAHGPSRVCFRYSETVSTFLMPQVDNNLTSPPAANSPTIPTMRQASSKSLSFRSARSSGPSQHRRKSSSSAIYRRPVLARYVRCRRPSMTTDTNIWCAFSQIMRRIMRKIVAGEGDQLGDLSTVAEPGVVDVIKKKVAESS